jgi:hypothetical protein
LQYGGGSVIDLDNELEAHRSQGCCRPGRGDSRDTTLLEHIRRRSGQPTSDARRAACAKRKRDGFDEVEPPRSVAGLPDT